ncbi:MAG: methyltransferase domain-containing protein [Patescibacteria group bacterium]|nr:methyltransferase domain-containing protein [Patescibacteria group bacterium]MDD5294694.1 methyltransferase domain-containing protein [Patescibacteria group bacterium]MDD5554434.1 methyltransferase domain-containing protein [Patescibacteria group bacterium]
MLRVNFQEKKWSGKDGEKYVLRNPKNIKETDKIYRQTFGITRSELNKQFLGGLNRSIKILEVGSNIGVKLIFLQKMGFKHLYGVEINRKAIEFSKKNTKGIDIIEGSALNIPFRDNYFDLVFTSGLLIHVSPKNLKTVMKEIGRCTKKYIWGYEYYADKMGEVMYRGKKNLLWKANFSKIYLDTLKNLKLVKERKIKYLDNTNEDVMFLLKKLNS